MSDPRIAGASGRNNDFSLKGNAGSSNNFAGSKSGGLFESEDEELGSNLVGKNDGLIEKLAEKAGGKLNILAKDKNGEERLAEETTGGTLNFLANNNESNETAGTIASAAGGETAGTVASASTGSSAASSGPSVVV